MARRTTTPKTAPRMNWVFMGTPLARSSLGRRLILIMLLVSRVPEAQAHAARQLRGDDLQVLRIVPLGVGFHVPEGVGHFAGDLQVLREVFHQSRQPRTPATQHDPGLVEYLSEE